MDRAVWAFVAVAVLAIGLASVVDGSPAPCADLQVSVDTDDGGDALDFVVVPEPVALIVMVERTSFEGCHELLIVAPEAHRILDSAPKTSPPRLV